MFIVVVGTIGKHTIKKNNKIGALLEFNISYFYKQIEEEKQHNSGEKT